MLKKIRKLLDALLITMSVVAIAIAALLVLAERVLRLLLEYWPIK